MAETTDLPDLVTKKVKNVPKTKSPSKFAEDASAFEVWCRGAMINQKECPEGVALFEEFTDFKLSTSILALPKNKMWDASGLTAYVQNHSLDSTVWVQEDVCDTAENWVSICTTFHKITSGEDSKEVVQRRGPDDMAMIAFVWRGQAPLDVRIEAGVHLCRSRSLVHPKPVAYADLLVVSPPLVLESWIEGIDDAADARPHLFWDNKRVKISIILFAAEFKHTVASTNRNQLIMGLSTAQYQRRALGLKKEVLFGGSSVNGLLQFYAAQWGPSDENPNTEAIFVYPVGKRYDISQPIPYLQCHSILCSMKDRHFGNLVKEFQAKKGADIAVTVKTNPWLAPKPPKSTVTTSGASTLELQSGGDNGQATQDVPMTQSHLLDEEHVDDGKMSGRRLTTVALAQISDGDSEALPLHVWRDVLMYPPQDANQPEP
ncbi:hypothetical protein FRB94_003560 [Tulasnella sp. JGI-2019a]|nr:hypothetical protein FRB94_003560 [Tulasnella sp. JGI-2019a]